MMRSKKERKKEPSKGEDSYCHAQQWPSKQVSDTGKTGLIQQRYSKFGIKPGSKGKEGFREKSHQKV